MKASAEVLRHWNNQDRALGVYLLKLKASGKELDPKYFDSKEQASFEDADRKEWMAWINNSCVRLLTPEEAQKVDPKFVFPVPLRLLRTNKAQLGQALQAKSRAIIPGHRDPALGEFRTDAPTCHPIAVALANSLAATRKWHGEVFDVETAFLSGNPTERQVFIRAPKEGFPALPERGMPAVEPGTLMQILKSAYGLTEAPRLWYLRMKHDMESCGFTELKCCRAVFVLLEPDSKFTCAVCCMHVDDGLIYGNWESSTYQKARKKLEETFKVKEWQDLMLKEVDYLGSYEAELQLLRHRAHGQLH